MKGGRLKIVNESRYPTEEVEALVRFGLQEIDLTGERCVVAVKNTRPTRRRNGATPAFSGLAQSLDGGGIISSMYDRYCGRRSHTHHLLLVRVGTEDVFPVEVSRRYPGVGEIAFRDWREAVVALAAHEGMHAQHTYDRAYRSRSGKRKAAMIEGQVVARAARVRVGVERIEPKCDAHMALILRRYREANTIDQEGFDLIPSNEQTAMAKEAAA